MFEFPTDFPIAEAKTLINSVNSEEQIPKGELVRAAWVVQGYVLSQLCGTPTLTIGTQAVRAEPVEALESVIAQAESDELVTQANTLNVPWATVLTWILDTVQLVLKDRA